MGYLAGLIGPIGKTEAVVQASDHTVTMGGGEALLGVFAAGDVKYDDTEGVARTVTFDSAPGWLPQFVKKIYDTGTTVADASLLLGLARGV